MGQFSKTLKNEYILSEYKTYSGFSFPAFFFVSIWFFVKGMYKQFLIYHFLYISPLILLIYQDVNIGKKNVLLSMSIFYIITVLPLHILAGMRANQWYKENLFNRGYK